MSLDERVRTGLSRLTEGENDELDRAAGEVLRRGRHRRVRRRAAAVAVSVAVLAGAVLAVPRLSGVLSSEREHVPAGTADPFREIAGTYRIHLSRAQAAVVAPELRGTWVMTLLPTGELIVVPSAGFLRTWGPPARPTFTVTSTELRTNAFTGPGLCEGASAAEPGIYTWSLSVDPDVPLLNGHRDVLRLAPVSEGCAARRLLLTADAWRRH